MQCRAKVVKNTKKADYDALVGKGRLELPRPRAHDPKSRLVYFLPFLFVSARLGRQIPITSLFLDVFHCFWVLLSKLLSKLQHFHSMRPPPMRNVTIKFTHIYVNNTEAAFRDGNLVISSAVDRVRS